MAVVITGNPKLLIILCLSLLSTTWAVEEVVIVHAPNAVKFLSSEPVHSSYLADIFFAMYAFTISNHIEWNSLAVVPPWKRPEAIFVLEFLGFNNKVDLPLEGNRFLLENMGDIDTQFPKLSLGIEKRYFEKRPVLLHMDLAGKLHGSKIAQPLLLKSVPADPKERLMLALADPELGQTVKDSTFNSSIPSDEQLLTELATVKELLKALASNAPNLHNGVPDTYWLKSGGLQSILASYGANTYQSSEALRLLRQLINEVMKTVRSIYSDNVVVAVIKENDIPSPFGHKNRKLLESTTTTESPKPEVSYNLAVKWDPAFPVIFAIVTFVTLLIALSVFSISVAMWHMDPGRDSIIYRMTSQRMKKD